MSKDESRKCQKEYGEGFKKGSRGGGWLEKVLDDTIGTVTPSTKEWDSHMAGIRDGMQERDQHEGQDSKSGGRSEDHEGADYGGSTMGSSGSVTAGRSPWGWLVLAGLSVVAIIAYVVGQQNGMKTVGSTTPLAFPGVLVYNLQCGPSFDVQMPPAVRRAILIVPPCKCSDLSELNYDCTGWVRIMEPESHVQMIVRNADGIMANECIFLEEYRSGRGPAGVSPSTPIKLAGCGGTTPEPSTLRTRNNPQGEPLRIPDRFTIQNVQQYPIRVSVDFP